MICRCNFLINNFPAKVFINLLYEPRETNYGLSVETGEKLGKHNNDEGINSLREEITTSLSLISFLFFFFFFSLSTARNAHYAR